MSNPRKRKSGKSRRSRGRSHASNPFTKTRRRSGRRFGGHRRNPAASANSDNSTKGMLELGGGGAAALLGSHYIAETFLPQYNTGVASYAVTAVIGAIIAWAGGAFVGRKFRTGAIVGTALAVAYRMYQDFAPTAPAAAAANVRDAQAAQASTSGLGTYTNTPFPFPATWMYGGGPGSGLVQSPSVAQLPSGQGPIQTSPGQPPMAALERDARF